MARPLVSTTLLALTLLAACRTGGKGDEGAAGTDTGVLAVDEDGDGFSASEDCDDSDASINAGATEVCDGLDNDCDGEVDEEVASTWYTDADGDGYGDPESAVEDCTQPPGTAANAADCDDSDDAVHPASVETCNGVDDNCDGEIDEGLGETWYLDTDGDGYGDPDAPVSACDAPSGAVANADDCDDTTADINPAAEEVCDEVDNDCDGEIDEGVTTTWYADDDGDNFGDDADTVEACTQPLGTTAGGGDCDDTAVDVNPDATEVCNAVDDDCDGTIDEPDAADASTWYADSDSDGYGDASAATTACTQPSGTVSNADDCDDSDGAVSPSGTELCNSVDDDCDGTVDEPDAADASTWYIDADSDTYGSSDTTVVDCSQPVGFVANDDDCDDADATIYPNSIEDWYDGVDADCDGFDDPDPCVATLPGETTVVDDPTCGVTGAASSSWNVAIEWQSADFTYASGAAYTRVMMTPAVGQITDDDGDGDVDETDTPDVVYVTFRTNRYRYDGYLRVISGDGTGEHWSLTSVSYGGATYTVHGSSGVALGDIDNDGSPDIVVMSTGGYIIALENDGTVKWVSSDAADSGYSQPAIANLDGYGTAEVVAANLVVDGYGVTQASLSSGGLNTSFASDFDLDGDQDIITGDAAWSPTGATTLSTSASTGRAAVANLDSDANGEIITRRGTSLLAIDDTGATLWSQTVDSGNGAPCVGDFDGDGDPDVGVAGRATFEAFDAQTGAFLWDATVFDTSSQSAGCSLFDFDGDGAQEVVYADQTDLFIWDGATGAELYTNAGHGSGTLYEFPYVADVDGDGNAEILVASNNYAFSGWDGITVLGETNDAWASALSTWNQFAYCVTNIEEDGSVPASPTASFADHNTFRAQDSWSDEPDGAPDLGVYILGVCEDCSAGSLELYAAVDNSGAVFVPAGVDVALYAVSGATETLLDVQQTASRIDPGVRLAPMTFTVATSDVGTDGLLVVVDDDGTGAGANTECDETNNEEAWDALTCP